jgi:hypothetical protein
MAQKKLVPIPFHVSRRYRGRGVEVFFEAKAMAQIAGQLGNLPKLPALVALRKTLTQELKGIHEDHEWSMEGAPQPEVQP